MVLITDGQCANSFFQMDIHAHYADAEALCTALCPKAMFTPLVMLEWLLNHCGRSLTDFVKRPNFYEEHQEVMGVIKSAKEEELRSLWESHTGVCTSWAVPVTLSLQKCGEKRDHHEYIYGEKHGHRAVWASDGIEIDSSARNALLLSEERITRGRRYPMGDGGHKDTRGNALLRE